MILMILSAATASASPNVGTCATAVRTNLPAAVVACDTTGIKVDLFSKDGMTDACLAAMKAGSDAGKYGAALGGPARESLIREFERKLQTCQTPPKSEPAPMRETVKLWD